jgi:hypothetical protein
LRTSPPFAALTIFALMRAGGIGAGEAVNDSAFGEVVRSHFKFDAVSDGQADKSLPHLARDVGQDGVAVVEFDSKHGIGQDLDHFAFDFNGIVGVQADK